MAFDVNHYLAPTKPEIYAPSNGSPVFGATTFRWRSITLSVDSYTVTISLKNAGTVLYQDINTQATTAFIPSTPISNDETEQIRVELKYTNSGDERTITNEYPLKTPKIITPVDNSTQPIGTILISWTKEGHQGTYHVEVKEEATGTVVFQEDTSNSSTFFRPPIDDSNTKYIVTVTYLPENVTLIHSFWSGKALPNSPTVLMFPPAQGGKEHYKFKTDIYLYRNGKEDRFTVTTVPLFWEETSFPTQKKHEALYSIIKKNGRNPLYLPSAAYQARVKVEKTKLTIDCSNGNPLAPLPDDIPLILFLSGDRVKFLPTYTKSGNNIVVGNNFVIQEERGVVYPLFEVFPDFTTLPHAGAALSAVSITTSKHPSVFIPDLSNTLLNDIGGLKVLNVPSPTSSRKINQLIESTTTGLKPEYFVIGESPIDLSSFLFGYASLSDKNKLINTFYFLMGQQESFYIVDYNYSYVILQFNGSSVEVEYPNNVDTKIEPGQQLAVTDCDGKVISIATNIGIVKENSKATLTFDTTIPANTFLRRVFKVRLSSDTLTLNNIVQDKGTCSLDFVEVIDE